ncbi:MAG: hypothetical protein Q9201_007431 [Fulgogasparrea decipioides]
MTSSDDEQALKDEIARLESHLAAARAKLDSQDPASVSPPSLSTTTHHLLLLSDSALPLGSFAFSSGLESYLAHQPTTRKPLPIQPFLSLALQTLATTSLPYLIAAYRAPERLSELDQELDACTLCHVARRASVSQGKALVTVWERAFAGTTVANNNNDDEEASSEECKRALKAMSVSLKKTASPHADAQAMGHFAPLWAVVTRALGIPLRDSATVFLLNHAKAVLSAAVRASVLGPYQAQAVLGSAWLREEVGRLMKENWEVPVEEAGQGVPMMDLWLGRHEMLYSRIFNS